VDFDLSESQYMLQDTLKRYFDKELPLARVHEIFDGGGEIEPELWRGLADLGLLGLVVPEEFGGGGFELLDVAFCAEMLGYGAVPGPFIEHVLAALALVKGGTAEQRERWLPGLADGSLRATVAFAEDQDHWIPGEWSITGGDLSGSKDWVLYPSGADLIVVGTAEGLSLVEGSAPGISVAQANGIDRTRQLATVDFDRVAHERLEGGLELAQEIYDAGLVLFAADAFGSAKRVLELAVEYAKTREQFGVTIGHFQALKHQLADMAIEVHPAQGLYWYASHAYDHVAEERSRMAALAKAHIGEIGVSVGRRAIEAHGGIGYTWEADVHLFLKRALLDRAYLGTPRALRRRVADLNGWPAAV
jgi:alkylation response protein AidB-like acyl-CoA dehydrogenase